MATLAADAVDSRVGPKNPKLRASCDGCFLSKVKCTKELPSCSRCSSHRLVCRYSPSQRAGKPRRPPGSHPTRDSHSRRPSESGTPVNHRLIDTSIHPALLEWSLESPTNNCGCRASSSTQLNDHTWPQDLYQPDQDVGSFSIGDTSFSPTQQLQSPLQSVRKNALNGKPVGCEEDVSSPSTLSQLALLYDPELPQNGFQSAFDVDSLQLANQASVAHTEVPDKFCTCSTTILETLHTLHKQSNNPQNPFDVVLSINKQALGSLSAVLVCSCARDPTSVITLAAAVTKMISWYQYTIFPVPKTMASHMPNLPSSPITIGAYRLNRADEDYVKTQVVLHELKKVELLIDKFYEMHSDQPEYRANGDLLRRRLKDAVEALQRVSRSSGVA